MQLPVAFRAHRELFWLQLHQDQCFAHSEPLSGGTWTDTMWLEQAWLHQESPSKHLLFPICTLRTQRATLLPEISLVWHPSPAMDTGSLVKPVLMQSGKRRDTGSTCKRRCSTLPGHPVPAPCGISSTRWGAELVQHGLGRGMEPTSTPLSGPLRRCSRAGSGTHSPWDTPPACETTPSYGWCGLRARTSGRNWRSLALPRGRWRTGR